MRLPNTETPAESAPKTTETDQSPGSTVATTEADPKTGRALRSGFTTGAAAAAAAKGAVIHLLTGTSPDSVRLKFPDKKVRTLRLHEAWKDSGDAAASVVIKDAGDDPDVTHKARIGAVVQLTDSGTAGGEESIVVTGGRGVGRVTRPGLEIPPGNPAITPGPMKMIRNAVTEAFSECNTPLNRIVRVEVFVPNGETLAKKTLNARLGILGGISILGTTGIVRPLSHDAYIATIRAGLSVARAADLPSVVLTTGRRSERSARRHLSNLPDQAFIQMGDFFQNAVSTAVEMRFSTIITAAFFGKAVKMATGVPHTHAGKSGMPLSELADWAESVTGNVRIGNQILLSPTARAALSVILPAHPEIVVEVGRRMQRSAERFAGGRASVRCIIFDFTEQILFDSNTGGSPRKCR
jgi:cobalt-precorrin-5B (C1)-methyltransferase